MNRGIKSALLVFGLMAGLGSSALGQNFTNDWLFFCQDPKLTMLHSNPYGYDEVEDNMFGASVGLFGTSTFGLNCFAADNTQNLQGRIGFQVGFTGSLQDDQGSPSNSIDDNMMLTFGMPDGVIGNFSIAKFFYTAAGGTTPTTSYFGQNTISLGYVGASDRYEVAESTNGSLFIHMRCDVLGDAARLSWSLQNTATTGASIYMWFGQWLGFLQENHNGSSFAPIGWSHGVDWITAPGYKPLLTERSFDANPNPNAVNPMQFALPPYVNFGLYQSAAYGLQVVLQPNAAIPDQTPCSGIDIGNNPFLLGSMTASDAAMPDLVHDDFALYPAYINGDIPVEGTDIAFLQKWPAINVTANTGNGFGGTDTATIVAYYRDTWSTSDYNQPYSAVLDAPPVVGTIAGPANAFANAPFNLYVQIDNTRGFSTIDQAIPMEDIKVTVHLPQGMYDANNPNSSTLVQTISQIQPATIGVASFKIGVNPTLFGDQQYTVTIAPNPGLTKTLTGTITVASQPFLGIAGPPAGASGPTANLVSAPWQFQAGDWASILSDPDPVTNVNQYQVDVNWQAFGWDPVQQQYVLQTGPQRGFGSFIISNTTPPAPLGNGQGFVSLGGNPSQVSDFSTGAPEITLQPGWNLIADPYNYPFEIGQIVGVPESGNQNSYTWAQLVTQNVISGFLAYWDPVIGSYNYTTSFTDEMQPNTGYWVFVQSPQPVVINYPIVLLPFVPGLGDPENFGGPKANANKSIDAPLPESMPTWTLPLLTNAKGAQDTQTIIGQTTTATLAKTLTRFKAPMAPLPNAVWSAIKVTSGTKTLPEARALTAQTIGVQTWNMEVISQKPGPVTLSWPAITLVPNNVSITLKDLASGRSVNLRTQSAYTFSAIAKTMHNFQVTVQSKAVLPVISSVAAAPGATTVNANYVLSVNASSTVTVVQNGTTIATLVSKRSDNAGTSKATWNYMDSANRQVRPGVYEIVVSSTPSGGATETKSVTFVAKH